MKRRSALLLMISSQHFVYNREDWLSEYAQMVTSDDMCESEGWFCFVLLLFQY